MLYFIFTYLIIKINHFYIIKLIRSGSIHFLKFFINEFFKTIGPKKKKIRKGCIKSIENELKKRTP